MAKPVAKGGELGRGGCFKIGFQGRGGFLRWGFSRSHSGRLYGRRRRGGGGEVGTVRMYMRIAQYELCPCSFALETFQSNAFISEY